EWVPTALRGVSIVSLDLGSKTVGTLVVGAARDGFPSELDQHVLRAAANQACVALLETTPKGSLAAESGSLVQLHRFTTGLIEAGDLSAVLEQMLAAAIDLQGADFGNVQLFDPDRGGLVIVAQRNFQTPFLEHFALVRADDSACARAAESRSRVIIE